MGLPLFCSVESLIALLTTVSQVGAEAFTVGARSVGAWGESCWGGADSLPAAICAGLPIIVVPMDCKSDGLNHTMSFGGVTTIRPIIAGGTPKSFATRAIETVAAPDRTVSSPLSDAPCTPILAL